MLLKKAKQSKGRNINYAKDYIEKYETIPKNFFPSPQLELFTITTAIIFCTHYELILPAGRVAENL